MKVTLSFLVMIPATCLIALQDGMALGSSESESFGSRLTSHRTAEESLSRMSAADSQAMNAALHTELLQLHNELAEARAEAKSQQELLRNVVAEITDLATERRHRDPFDSAPSADDLAAGTQALSHQRFDTRSSPDVAPELTFERLANKAAHSKAHPSKGHSSEAAKPPKAPTVRALRSAGLNHDSVLSERAPHASHHEASQQDPIYTSNEFEVTSATSDELLAQSKALSMETFADPFAAEAPEPVTDFGRPFGSRKGFLQHHHTKTSPHQSSSSASHVRSASHHSTNIRDPLSKKHMRKSRLADQDPAIPGAFDAGADAAVADAPSDDAGAFDAPTDDAGAFDAPTDDAGAPDEAAPDEAPADDAGAFDAPTDDAGAPAGTTGAPDEAAPAGTTAGPDEAAPAGTTAAPDEAAPAGTTAAPDEAAPAGTTAAPDEAALAGTTAAPVDDSVEEGATTAAPEEKGENGATTAAPEEGEDEATTAAPEEEVGEEGATTAAPEEEGEDGATTAAPEEEAEEGATTAAPDEEKAEEGGDATESFARQSLPFFGLICAIVVHAIVL